MERKRLTECSESSGCGCKIAPAVLNEILDKSHAWQAKNENILVGNDSKDDASVYDLGNGNALISTVDFFTPIVDDAFDYGRIAAANAISDIYAMGGKPVFANVLLSWPVDLLGTDEAARVLEGARTVCTEAGVTIAGGHSIAGKEPIFGLAVNGFAEIKNIKQNNTARPGDLLYLTKPIGVGILATAIKRQKIEAGDYEKMLAVTTQLNDVGMILGTLTGVSAMTDITGFGLLGHLLEMCEGSGCSAEIQLDKIPVISGIQKYIDQYIFPDNTYKNWNACEPKTAGVSGMELTILCDPQTSGGLLVSVDPGYQQPFEEILGKAKLPVFRIGTITAKKEKAVHVMK